MKEKNKIYKILLVDDDKFLLDMYATKFSEGNFEVSAVFGATEAISKLEEGYAPEIILTDVVMPIMDGFDFLTEIKKRKFAQGAHIIILSNLGQKEDLDKGKELGACGYIVKATSTPTEVVNQVLKIIESE
ncbi:MAG: response regulator [Candidatus Paceibacterota bacterium]|jgi:DNA-binding response OmpR family regulator